MREVRVHVPEFALLMATRVMLGAGLGLLLSARLRPARRGSVGWTLFLIGAASTFPLLAGPILRSRGNAHTRGDATAVMGG